MRRLIGVLVVIALVTCLASVGPAQTGGRAPAGGLAESWTVSPNGLVNDLALRANAHLHNGERVTAEDVKRSFGRDRYGTTTSTAGWVRGGGPRVEEPALALVPAFPYWAPYEDVRLKP